MSDKFRIGGARMTKGSGSHNYCSGKCGNCVFWIDEIDGEWLVGFRPMNSTTPIEIMIQVAGFSQVTTMANGCSVFGKARFHGETADEMFTGYIGKSGQVRFAVRRYLDAKIQRGKLGDWSHDVYITNPDDSTAKRFIAAIGATLMPQPVRQQDRAA